MNTQRPDFAHTVTGIPALLNLMSSLGACEPAMDWVLGCALDKLTISEGLARCPQDDWKAWLRSEWLESLDLDAYKLQAYEDTLGLVPSAHERERLDTDALIDAAKARGILVADNFAYLGQPAWILCFGAYGTTKVLCWGKGIEDALEDAASVLPKGHFYDMQDRSESELRDLVNAGADPDDENTQIRASEAAEVDMTYTEAGWLASWEWGISCKGATMADVLKYEVKS